MSILEEVVRYLNESAQRLAVLKPVKLIITNYPEDKTEWLDVPVHPQKPELGRRKSFCKKFY